MPSVTTSSNRTTSRNEGHLKDTDAGESIDFLHYVTNASDPAAFKAAIRQFSKKEVEFAWQCARDAVPEEARLWWPRRGVKPGLLGPPVENLVVALRSEQVFGSMSGMSRAPAAAVCREAEVAAVEGRVAELMGVINAATAQLVEVVAEAERTLAWEGWGIRSLEHWVTWRCGVSVPRANRLVSMARALPALPAVSGVFEAGSLSEDQAAIVCRHATPGTDAVVAELAPLLTVPQLGRVVASIPQPPPDPVDEPDEERQPVSSTRERRRVTFGHDDDGTWWLRALLPPDVGAVVEQALAAGRDAEFRDRHPDLERGDGAASAAARDRVSWADGLVRLAETGLEALEQGPEGEPARPGGERFEVVVHIDADRATPTALHLGPLLPVGIDHLVTCDATVRAVIERLGQPVALGRRRRTVPRRLRRLIEGRDGGCRIPGCGRRHRLHIHHLVHWSAGGPTDPDNLLALCPAHHRLVHLGRLFITGDPTRPDGLEFTDLHGRRLTPARASPTHGPPVDAARRLGVPTPLYQNPLGEPLHDWAIVWN